MQETSIQGCCFGIRSTDMTASIAMLDRQTGDVEGCEDVSGISASSYSVSKCNQFLRVLITLILAVIFCVQSVSSCSNSSEVSTKLMPIVTVAQGKLRGNKTLAGPYLFNSIPFAQPPVGKLRWQPPHLPPPSWTGVRDAVEVPNVCYQHQETAPINGAGMGSEDCLYLNVYTKRITVVNDTTTNCTNTTIVNPDERLSPVIVFVHGGSSIDGWSALSIYDHSILVANRDVVAVTVNYRLNVFGYLALDVLTANQHNTTGRATSGNYGLQDNIAALKWVKANIAAFGGDPCRVTLYGQSSGATNVVSLYMSPLARGLFDAALSLSASPVLNGDLAFASKQNEPFLPLSGCDNKTTDQETLDCVYALSPQEALSAMPPRWLNASDFGLVNFSFPDAALIIVDDYVVPAEINTALSHGFGADVVLGYGNMAQEVDLEPAQRPVGYNQEQFAQWMTDFTPTLGWNSTQTQKIIELYPISDYQNDSMLTYEVIVDDSSIVCGGMVNLNNTATSQPPHTSPIFHHLIHYHPSVPFEYIGPTGWPIANAGHAWELLLLLETYSNAGTEYPAVEADYQHTELLRQLWIDQLATKLTITDTALWPPFNEGQLSGKPNSTWTLEFLEDGNSTTPSYVATANYHGDKCAVLREYGFTYVGWTN